MVVGNCPRFERSVCGWPLHHSGTRPRRALLQFSVRFWLRLVGIRVVQQGCRTFRPIARACSFPITQAIWIPLSSPLFCLLALSSLRKRSSTGAPSFPFFFDASAPFYGAVQRRTGRAGCCGRCRSRPRRPGPCRLSRRHISSRARAASLQDRRLPGRGAGGSSAPPGHNPWHALNPPRRSDDASPGARRHIHRLPSRSPKVRAGTPR